ncbi:MAG: flagellar M-ring protein FliF, partial [Rhodospirillales bacterium]|nr:flagellar M-ring protein FliF [Rhodospirillales bacterium]
ALAGAPGSADILAQPGSTEVEAMIDLNKVEGRVRASSIHKIGEIVEKHPEEAVAIVRSWLYQED